MQINIGEYEVYKEGTIIGLENEPIEFIFNREIGFVIRIIFANDTEQTVPRLEGSAYEKNGATITFYNFNNSLGIGNATPMQVGKLNGRELHFNYRIHSLERGGKTLHYTWLLGKEVQNG